LQNRRQLSAATRFFARRLRDQTHGELVYSPFQFQKRSQYFIGTHDETLSVVAVRVSYPECSDLGHLFSIFLSGMMRTG
jgi:hypothetical protein